MSITAADYSKYLAAQRSEWKLMGYIVDIEGNDYIARNTLVELLMDDGGDMDNILRLLHGYSDLGFVASSQMGYPLVPFDREGVYYKFDWDMSGTNWKEAAAASLSIEQNRSYPKVKYTFDFATYIRTSIGLTWRTMRQYMDPFYTAAFEHLQDVVPDGLTIEGSTNTDGPRHTWQVDLPLQPASVEEGIYRCTRDKQIEFKMTDLVRTTFHSMTGTPQYYGVYDLTQDMMALFSMVLDFHGYRYIEDDNRVIVKPIELDDRHLTILSECLKDETNVLYNEDFKFFLIMPYLAKLRDTYGPGVTLEQLKLDVFSKNGTAAQIMLDNRITARVHHTWTFKRGSYDRTRHPVLKFMFNDEFAKVREIPGSVGSNIPTISFYCHDEKLVYMHVSGPRNSVNAMWAFLVSKKVHQLNGMFFRMDGSKDHTMLKQMMPSGLLERIYIHKDMQNISESSASRWFYVLDDGVVPAGFEAALNRIVKIPVHSEWISKLFFAGFKRGLIYPITSDYIGSGMFIIDTMASSWKSLISSMVKEEELLISVDNSN